MAATVTDYLRRSREKLRDLCDIAADARKVLILTHDNPDPDALASCVALRHVLKHAARRDSVIAHGGSIGRPENRTVARSLRAGMRPWRDIDVRGYRVIALVDTQPRTGNHALPPEVTPSVVIDHHQVRNASWDARFTDIRTDYGATSTILTEYLQALDAPIPRRLATALFYGIQSDTRNLARSRHDADRWALTHLFPLIDPRQLAAIEHARVTRHHFEIIRRAIDHAMVYGDLVLSEIGRVESPDDVAESSDELIRLENIRWAAAMGMHNGDLYISLRSGGRSAEAARVLRRVVGRMGSAGGHGDMAGARIPLKRPATESTPEETRMKILERLLEVLGGKGREGRPLLPGGEAGERNGSPAAPAEN